MSFETAADAFIRPSIGPTATPAHGAAASAATSASAASAQQAAWLNAGASGERGARADHETAASEISFYDLLDVINPLQHIPGIASAYRAITGDEIKAPAQILGSALYGGPLGLVASVANAVVKESSGRDIGEAALAMLFGDEPAPGDVAAASGDALSAAAPDAPLDAAELAPAAGAANAAYTPMPGVLPDAALPDAESEQATARVEDGSAEADAVAQALEPTAGATLSGKAALNAFLDDLATLGRSAEGATQPGSETLADSSSVAREAALARPAAAERASTSQGNLIGLGSRDKRPGARLTGAAQPAIVSGTAKSPPRIVSGAAPHLPGGAALDPTFFAPVANGEPSALPAAPPESGDGAPNAFSQQMMRALQKYETLLQDQPAAGGDPG
jgi:hypothetical protein